MGNTHDNEYFISLMIARGNMNYDGAFGITRSNTSDVQASSSSPGVFTGNGKIGMYVSMSNIATTRCMLSGNTQFDQIGKYVNNTIDTFHVTDVAFTNFLYDSSITPVWQQQSLDMETGTVTTSFNIRRTNATIVQASSVVRPLRQYPYCVLQTITFQTTSNLASSDLDVYHIIRTPATGLASIEYNNNTIFNESVSTDQGIYMLLGTGYDQQHKCDVTSGSCYLFPTSVANSVKPVGFNILNDKSMAYQKFRFSGLTAGTSYTFHILNTLMTSYDFTDTIEEVKRITLNIMFRDTTVSSLVTRMITDHKAMWRTMWEADVEINAKTNLDAQALQNVQSVRRFTRHCLFNVFACLREAVNTEINPLNLSFIDADGNVFFDGDLWLLPLLTILKPNIARTLLEYKYKALEQAMQLSASFGYIGSKFPYRNDVLGYKNVYWDVMSPLHIFNNASIAVNIWNYFRVSQDLTWLQSKGYIMMQSITDFLYSYMKKNGTLFTVPNVLGLGETISDDHAFTINMIYLAFLYIQQAANRLGYRANTKWIEVTDKLALPIETFGTNTGVIRYFNTYNMSGNVQVDVVDNIIPLLPLFNRVYFNVNSSRTISDVGKNLTFYLPKIKSAYSSHVWNNMFIMGAYSFLSQSVSSNMTNVITYISKVLQDNVVGDWGYVNTRNDPARGNDITINALFVLLILTCFCGVKINGSTNPSNVTVEAYGIEIPGSGRGAIMPSTWSSVNIRLSSTNGAGFNNVMNTLSS